MKRQKSKKFKKFSKAAVVGVLTFLMCLALSACGVVAGSGRDNLVVDDGEIEMGEKVAYATGGQLQFSSSALTSAYTVVNAVGSGATAVSGNFVMEKGYVYYFQVYGGKGGNDYYGGVGGSGGYSHGYYDMTSATANQTVYYYAGGVGQTSTSTSSASVQPGGYNGGGNGGKGGTKYGGGGGGGASHIATASGLLSAMSSTANKAKVLIVAAGGGGGGGSSGQAGGAGGGETGGAGVAGETDNNGKGATQSAGGAAGALASGVKVGTAGSFGQGGTAGNGGTCGSIHAPGGGGGGWFGGGGGGGKHTCGGGGGGSGYVGGVRYLSGQSASMMTAGVNAGEGKVVVTRYAAVNMKNPSFTLKRGQAQVIANTEMATEPINTSVALTYVTSGTPSASQLYLDAACTQSASNYVLVSNVTAASITVTPKLSMINTTLYVYMNCSNPSFKIGIPVKFTTTDQQWVAAKNNVALENNNTANFGVPTVTGVPAPSNPSQSGLIYNPVSGATTKTFFVQKPIGTNSTLTISASNIYSDAVKK